MSEEKSEGLTERRARRRAERRGIRRFEPDTTVPSPCISVCQFDNQTSLCIGCQRSIDEIRDWMIMSADQKREVLTLIEERKNPATAP